MTQTHKNTKHRDWCFTLNNYTESDEYHLFGYPHIEDISTYFPPRIFTECKSLNYIICAKEIGESGTPHLQGYMEFENTRYLTGVKKLCGTDRIHLEPKSKHSTNEQCKKYCMKGKQSHSEWLESKWKGPNFGLDADFHEHFRKIKEGKQGKRTDLIKLRDEIFEGKSVDSIAKENPPIYHQYKRTLRDLESIKMKENKRTGMTLGEWHFGKTGSGKTEFASTYCDENNQYWMEPDDRGWWDDYFQQEVVIINDFRGEIKYNSLLKIVDKFKYVVSRRGQAPIPFTSKMVIVTSSLHPKQVYKNRELEDSLDQFYRRFKVFFHEKIIHDNNSIEYKMTEVGDNDPLQTEDDVDGLIDLPTYYGIKPIRRLKRN